MGLSGGVDSTVAAELLHRAIGDRLICFFVDNVLGVKWSLGECSEFEFFRGADGNCVVMQIYASFIEHYFVTNTVLSLRLILA